MGLNHTRGHLWRALLEGIALSFVDCQQVLEDDGVALDGRRRRRRRRQQERALSARSCADALGVPLSYASTAGGTVAGAAILAGMGIGALTTPWRTEGIRHEPSPEAHAKYRALLPIRRAAYTGRSLFLGSLAPFSATLAREQSGCRGRAPEVEKGRNRRSRDSAEPIRTMAKPTLEDLKAEVQRQNEAFDALAGAIEDLDHFIVPPTFFADFDEACEVRRSISSPITITFALRA